MKKTNRSWLTRFLLFSLFFPIGFWTGLNIYPLNSEKSEVANFFRLKGSETKNSFQFQIKNPSNQVHNVHEIVQTNFLILFVDDLGGQKSTLTSAWLLIHPHDSTRLIFLPIFQEGDEAKELISTFSLDKNKLNKRFVKALEKRNILWNSFLAIDNRAKDYIVINIVPSLEQSSLTSHDLIKAVCQTLPSSPNMLYQIKRLIPTYIIANFNVETALDIWHFRSAHQPYLQCEFPSDQP